MKEGKTQLYWFLAGAFFLMASVGSWDTVFNNYLSDVFNITEQQRGYLEFPREFPGFMVVFMTGLLAALPIARIGMISGLLVVFGALAVTIKMDNFSLMLVMMVVISAGVHLHMPIVSTIALASVDEKDRGKRMGLVASIYTIGLLLGSGCVRVICHFKPEVDKYNVIFVFTAIFAALSAYCYSRLHLPDLHQKRQRLVYRKKFTLYYWLEILFGARKQLFITFGPWVLIKIYGLGPARIAELFMIASVIGIAFKFFAGRFIDMVGERVVLVFDGIVLTVICLGYGYSQHLFDDNIAVKIVSACYIIDSLIFALGHARSVYVSRISDDASEMSGTLSMGITINHVSSMAIPTCAGIVWAKFGYEKVFLMAAGLAVMITFFSCMIPGKKL